MVCTTTGVGRRSPGKSFMIGLCPTVKAEVTSRWPIKLDDMMQEALLVEDRNLAISIALGEIRSKPDPNSKPYILIKSSTWRSYVLDNKSTRLVFVAEKPNGPKLEMLYKWMSDAEYQTWRDKGLCFRCDEKFFKGIDVKSRRLGIKGFPGRQTRWWWCILRTNRRGRNYRGGRGARNTIGGWFLRSRNHGDQQGCGRTWSNHFDRLWSDT